MKPCLGDTSYFLAMLIPSDALHENARRWSEDNRRPIITTDYVLLEVANFLSPQPTRGLFRGFAQTLHSARRITLIKGTPELLQCGIDLYIARLDKSWSLTDCISFAVMKENDLSEALTADRHFEQAGFKILLTDRRSGE